MPRDHGALRGVTHLTGIGTRNRPRPVQYRFVQDSLTIISWNVNGLRSVLGKGFRSFLRTERPGILCLQETRLSPAVVERERFRFPGYRVFYNHAHRPGYSGTAVFVRKDLPEPSAPPRNGFGTDEFDREGRIQVLETASFFLVNTYFPNANHELSRLDYKLRFDRYLLTKLRGLRQKKPVIVCGDFNVAHREIDLARPKQNVGNPGFTHEERAWMDSFIRAGFRDTFRELQGGRIQYSWWSFRSGARDRNIGWRIDYVCTSAGMLNRVREAFILDHVRGSDHCPVGLRVRAERLGNHGSARAQRRRR